MNHPLKNIKIWLVCILVGIGVAAKAQYDTAKYTGNFSAFDMDMWGSGGFDPNMYFEFFNEHWNEGGSIDMTFDFFGMRFGPYFDVFTQGDIAMGFGLQGFTSGTIDSIIYPANIEFLAPQSGSFNAGELINIRSNLSAGSQSAIFSSYPGNGSLFLDYTFGAEFMFEIGICGGPLGCTDTKLDFGTQDGLGNYEPIKDTIFKLTTDKTDSSYVYGFADWPVIDPALAACLNLPPSPIPEKKYFDLLPVEIERDASRKKVDKEKNENGDSISVISNPYISASLDVPYIAKDEYEQIIQGQKIKAIGESEYIELGVDIIGIAQTAAGFTQGIKGEIPVIPCVMSIQYSFFNADFETTITNNQELTFTPSVNIILEFPSPVFYQVFKNGLLIDQNTSDSISYTLGDDLKLGFPCDYNFMDLKPKFVMGGKLHNHTYDEIDFTLALQALVFKIIINKITIIPEFSFPICFWNPFGSDWCTTVTIPEVAFDEEEFPLGPLWELPIPLGTATLEWMDSDIDLAPFNVLESAPFRIEPIESTIDLLVTDVACAGDSSGLITLSETGTNHPLSYNWSNGKTSQNLTNIPAGEYYVKITDAAGCVSYQGALIKEPEPLEILNVEIKNVSCYNGNDGSISIEAKGGVGPKTISWSTGSTSNQISNVTAGTYTVEISDGTCTIGHSFEITQPHALEAYVANSQNPSCSDKNDGFIELSVQGGVEPYSYNWSTQDVAPKIEELSGGLYTVTVTDAKNCNIDVNKTLVQPDLLTAEANVLQEVSCFNYADGIISLDIQGGTKPYRITWYGTENTLKSNTINLNNLSGGIYRAKIVDSMGCSVITEKQMPTPENRISSTLSETHVSCFDGADGKIDLTLENAVGNVAYDWSNGETTEDVSDLSTGKYVVNIMDENGCVDTNNTYLLQATEIIIDTIIRTPSCVEETDGKIKVKASGGFPPYTYKWSNNVTADSITNLGVGTYTVNVTDSKNCLVTQEYLLESLIDKCIAIPNAFTPNNDGLNDKWRIRSIELFPNAEVTIFTKWGEKIYHAKGANIEPWDGKFKGKDLPNATYYYVLDMGDGSEPEKGSVTIAR